MLKILIRNLSKLININKKFINSSKKTIYPNNKLIISNNKLVNSNNKLVNSNNKLVNSNNKLVNSNNKLLSLNSKFINSNNDLINFNKELLNFNYKLNKILNNNFNFMGYNIYNKYLQNIAKNTNMISNMSSKDIRLYIISQILINENLDNIKSCVYDKIILFKDFNDYCICYDLKYTLFHLVYIKRDCLTKMLVLEYIASLGINLNKISIINYANLNFYNNKWLPIHYACYNNDIDLLNLLVKYKVNLEITDAYNNTPLHIACKNNNLQIAKLLIYNGVNLELENNKGDKVIDYFYSKETDINLVRLLINNKVNYEYGGIDYNGKRKICLNEACYKGNYELVKLLLKHKVNINDHSIHNACYSFNLDVIRLLIENNANLHIKNKDGNTPINLIFQKDYLLNVDLIKMLINKNANFEHKDNHGNYPIHYACFNKNIEVVRLLINNKINLESSNNKMCNRPIHIACQTNNPKLMKLLINNNVNLEAENNEGNRPIHILCSHKVTHHNIKECFKLLVESNINLQEKNKYGETPMRLLCLSGQREYIKVLVYMGVQMDKDDILCLYKTEKK